MNTGKRCKDCYKFTHCQEQNGKDEVNANDYCCEDFEGLENSPQINIQCPYCGEETDSSDPRVLCKDCRETFGHTFIDEL